MSRLLGRSFSFPHNLESKELKSVGNILAKEREALLQNAGIVHLNQHSAERNSRCLSLRSGTIVAVIVSRR